MKTLINPQTTISADGKKCTVEFDIVEKEFSPFLVQRVTIGHLNPKNMRHPRHVQISEEAIFVKAFGNGMAFPIDDVVQMASVIEPKTSFAPVFKKSENPFTVEIASELNPDFQWQVCEDVSAGKQHRPNGEWKDIEGQKTITLDQKTVSKNQWIRCVASSEAGSMASNPIQVK